jgi:hypothetical protein
VTDESSKAMFLRSRSFFFSYVRVKKHSWLLLMFEMPLVDDGLTNMAFLVIINF